RLFLLIGDLIKLLLLLRCRRFTNGLLAGFFELLGQILLLFQRIAHLVDQILQRAEIAHLFERLAELIGSLLLLLLAVLQCLIAFLGRLIGLLRIVLTLFVLARPRIGLVGRFR